MTQGNSKKLGSGDYVARRDSDWDKFDALPRAVRDAINYAPFDFNPRGAYDAVRRGVPAAAIVAWLEAACARKAAEDRHSVWGIPKADCFLQDLGLD